MKIAFRSWRPFAKPSGIVVIVPGFKSHGGYYGWVAEQFSGDGLAVYAVDLRGRGGWDGERFYVDKFADYVSDVSGIIDIAKAREPGLPVFLLGHSAGGNGARPLPLRWPYQPSRLKNLLPTRAKELPP